MKGWLLLEAPRLQSMTSKIQFDDGLNFTIKLEVNNEDLDVVFLDGLGDEGVYVSSVHSRELHQALMGLALSMKIPGKNAKGSC